MSKLYRIRKQWEDQSPPEEVFDIESLSEDIIEDSARFSDNDLSLSIVVETDFDRKQYIYSLMPMLEMDVRGLKWDGKFDTGWIISPMKGTGGKPDSGRPNKSVRRRFQKKVKRNQIESELDEISSRISGVDTRAIISLGMFLEPYSNKTEISDISSDFPIFESEKAPNIMSVFNPSNYRELIDYYNKVFPAMVKDCDNKPIMISFLHWDNPNILGKSRYLKSKSADEDRGEFIWRDFRMLRNKEDLYKHLSLGEGAVELYKYVQEIVSKNTSFIEDHEKKVLLNPLPSRVVIETDVDRSDAKIKRWMNSQAKKFQEVIIEPYFGEYPTVFHTSRGFHLEFHGDFESFGGKKIISPEYNRTVRDVEEVEDIYVDKFRFTEPFTQIRDILSSMVLAVKYDGRPSGMSFMSVNPYQEIPYRGQDTILWDTSCNVPMGVNRVLFSLHSKGVPCAPMDIPIDVTKIPNIESEESRKEYMSDVAKLSEGYHDYKPVDFELTKIFDSFIRENRWTLGSILELGPDEAMKMGKGKVSAMKRKYN